MTQEVCTKLTIHWLILFTNHCKGKRGTRHWYARFMSKLYQKKEKKNIDKNLQEYFSYESIIQVFFSFSCSNMMKFTYMILFLR